MKKYDVNIRISIYFNQISNIIVKHKEETSTLPATYSFIVNSACQNTRMCAHYIGLNRLVNL